MIRRVPEGASLYLSVINLGEIAYGAERERGDQGLRKTLEVRVLPIALVGVDERAVLAAAHIKANHRVSYAEAFAIALAQELNAKIVTGDPEFKNVEMIVEILWLTEPKRKIMRERHAAYRAKPRRMKQV